MSSTKEGNPPIAMKVKNAATNMSIEPLAWEFTSNNVKAVFSSTNAAESFYSQMQ
jgi:hypothetical protein